MRVNTRSVFLMSKAVIPVMRAQEGGAIVNISSAATRVSLALLAYKMSKAAVEQATTAIADGKARYGIRANPVLPGLIETPLGGEHTAGAHRLTRDEWGALAHAQATHKEPKCTDPEKR